MRKRLVDQWLCLLLLWVAVLAMPSCSDNDGTDESAATLTGENATSHSLSFTITPQHAEQCAWMCVKKGEGTPSPDDILSGGIGVDVHQTSTQTAIALEAKTDYVIWAAALSGGRKVLSAPLEMTTLEVTQDTTEAEAVKLTRMVDAAYSADKKNKVGNYVLLLASGDTDEEGYPVRMGDVAIQLDFYNALDADPMNATLPSGKYTPAKDKSAFTYDSNNCLIYERTAAGTSGITYSLLLCDSILVERQGDVYTIHIDGTTLAEQPVKATYTGVLVFTEAASSGFENFDTPQDVTFNVGQGRYYGNWDYPFADDWMLEFYDAEFDENNSMVSGYYLTLSSFFVHKLADYHAQTPEIEEGTYTVSKRLASEITNIPMTFTFGELTELWGASTNTGSYLMKIDKETGKKYVGHFTGGTVTVSRAGSGYSFDFDLTTTEGISVKGKFDGNMAVVNKNDNDASMPDRLGSTLAKDVTLKFPSNTKATAYFLGEDIFPGLNSWSIQIGLETQDQGDWISTEMLTLPSQGMVLNPGTYAVYERAGGSKKDPGANELIPGWFTRGGQALYTWYSDMSTRDSDGYIDVLGRVVSGTMKVEKNGDTYRFIFDFKDDRSHKITGEWSGPVSILDYTNPPSQSKLKAIGPAVVKHR